MQTISNNSDVENIHPTSHCQKVSVKEYEVQSLSASQRALEDLLDNIISSDQMGVKDKKKKLKRVRTDGYHRWFCKCHHSKGIPLSDLASWNQFPYCFLHDWDHFCLSKITIIPSLQWHANNCTGCPNKVLTLFSSQIRTTFQNNRHTIFQSVSRAGCKL